MHGSWARVSQPAKRHLSQFRFCMAHSWAQHAHTHTMLHTTSVSIGRIYAMHVMRSDNNNPTFTVQESHFCYCCRLWEWECM